MAELVGHDPADGLGRCGRDPAPRPAALALQLGRRLSGHVAVHKTYPLSMETYPLSMETYPLSMETYPLSMETYPLSMETYPLYISSRSSSY